MIIDFEGTKNRTKKGSKIHELEENLRTADEALEEALNPTDLRVRNGLTEGPDLFKCIRDKADAEQALLLERNDGKPEDFEEDLEIMRKLKAGEITEDELMDQEYGEGSSEYFHKIMEEGWELEDEE